MKRTYTEISAVRRVQFPSKSIVKIKRHSFPQGTHSSRGVAFNITSFSNDSPLPAHIPQEQLEELETSSNSKSIPVLCNKPLRRVHSTRKVQSPKTSKSSRDTSSLNPDSTSEIKNALKLAADIQAIEEKLSKVEHALTKNVDEKLSNTAKIESKKMSRVSNKKVKPERKPITHKSFITEERNLQPYNASDYSDECMTSGYNQNYVSELHRPIEVPLRNEQNLNYSYIHEYDPKSTICAIQNELAEWRKSRRVSSHSDSVYTKKAYGSSNGFSPTAEEGAVSRDITPNEDGSLPDEKKPDLPTSTKQKSFLFPLDRFMNREDCLQGSGKEEITEPQKVTLYKEDNLLKNITKLSVEADRLVKTCTFPTKLAAQSTKTSSTSLNESTESDYTEQLVERKFKEVTFRKQEIKQSTSQPKMKSLKHATSDVGVCGRTRHEECISFKKEPIFCQPVMTSHCHISHNSVQNEDLLSPKTCLTEESCAYDQPITECSNSVPHSCGRFVKPKFKHPTEQPRYNYSPPTKLSSSRTTSSYCNCLRSKQFNSCMNLSSVKTQSKETFETGISYCKGKSIQNTKNLPKIVVDAHNKNIVHSDACVNTDEVKNANSSLVRVVCDKETFTSINPPRLYQIQELPRVNIRPYLTKQLGPVIDIKVSKPIISKNNVSVEECVHKERVCRNVLLERKLSSKLYSKDQCDIKLKQITKDFLKRLEPKMRSNIAQLKGVMNTLLSLLNQISPIQKAPLRTIEENIMNESMDLLFRNIESVTKLLEKELEKTEQFCKFPDYITKSVHVLCNCIRSNFVVREKEKTFVKSSINSSCFGCSIANSNKYIPFRKLVPGGKYKVIEEATTQKELELRQLRLKKINEINESLKDDLSSIDISLHGKAKAALKDGDNGVLNRTFIIENNENESNAEIKATPSVGEISRKSEVDYEDDWEQEWGSSDSGAEFCSGMVKLEVQAQVHKSDEDTNSQPTETKEVQVQKDFQHDSVEIKVKSKSNSEHCEESKIVISTSSQTDHFPEITKQIRSNESTPQQTKQIEHIQHNSYVPENISYPIIRMTNPITSSLLEVRFPFQSDKIQSSILVEKSENKEEIKLLYNLSNQEKVQTWPRSIKTSDITNKRQKITCNSSLSVSNLPSSSVIINSDQKANNNGNSNNFQLITRNFLDFLENKVTEMLKKIKSSEGICNKMNEEGVKSMQGHQELYHPRIDVSLRSNNGPYKSVSSIFSNKSIEELIIQKSLVTRGCSPGNEGMHLENLVSPPVTLKFKNDATSQTDVLPNVCIRRPPEISGLISSLTNCIKNEHTNATTGEKSLQNFLDTNLITIDTNLRHSDVTLDFANDSLSVDRLLPLPEDVLNESLLQKHNNNIYRQVDTLNNSHITLNQKISSDNDKVESFSKCISPMKNNRSHTEKTCNTQVIRESLQKSVIQCEVLSHLEPQNYRENAVVVPQDLQIGNRVIGRTLQSPQNENVLPQTSHLSNSNFKDISDLFKDQQEVQSTSLSVQSSCQHQGPTESLSTYSKNLRTTSDELVLHIGQGEEGIVSSSCNVLCDNSQKNNCVKPLNCSLMHKMNVQCDLSAVCLSGEKSKGEEGYQVSYNQYMNLFKGLSSNKVPIISDAVSDEAHDSNSSLVSEENIPIYYFNSDEMSEGEVQFVYTSNSYSSGEIKPATGSKNAKIKENNNLSLAMSKGETFRMSSIRNDRRNSIIPSESVNGDVSSNSNISTRHLQQI